MTDLLLKGGEVLDPSQNLRGTLDIAVQDGSISQVAPNIRPGPETRVVDVSGKLVVPDWDFSQVVSPDDYAKIAADWVANHGVTIIGGCCGTGADHIRALTARLAG